MSRGPGSRAQEGEGGGEGVEGALPAWVAAAERLMAEVADQRRKGDLEAALEGRTRPL